MSNVLIEQYAVFKKQCLEESPYKCLLDSDIDINPHQVEAFCAAIQSLKDGGIVLADEVGLGKTIEAGLALKYAIKQGAKRILLAMPNPLRKQWEIELKEKFGIHAIILTRYIVEHDYYETLARLKDSPHVQVVITTYGYASKLMKRFPMVKWDLMVIDEAHHLRNAFNGAKRAKELYEISRGIPKIMLTATPIQNSLSDIYATVSFVDQRIFGNQKLFTKRYEEGGNYTELKEVLAPVLHRTLRRDVSTYMQFPERKCYTFDFELSIDELTLYQRVNAFLKRDTLYSLPTANRNMITLVIRKLLASSSFALIETFEILKERLEKLYDGTKSSDAQEGFDLFWSYLEDEVDEEQFSKDDDDTIYKKEQIQNELDEVEAIIEVAERITSNAKMTKLIEAVAAAFKEQKELGIDEKVVIFTESKRTQKYMRRELLAEGYSEEDILLFNGEMTDELSKEIYKTWQIKNFGKTNYGRDVEFKHAIMDYFKNNAKILILTDAGSEGLNLQFCNTVVNYDLPWNPQKIEQRIGRCHRYGQKNTVFVMNFLNRNNEADKRVYDILRRKFELFEGVFGASDVALGALDNGVNFEKKILQIYQTCSVYREFKREFDNLDRSLDKIARAKVSKLRDILNTSSSEKADTFADLKAEIDAYCEERETWDKVKAAAIDIRPGKIPCENYRKENILGDIHGFILIGAFTDCRNILAPALFIFDEFGKKLNKTEGEVLRILESLPRTPDLYYLAEERTGDVYDKAVSLAEGEMHASYKAKVAADIARFRKKIINWADIRKAQLNLEISEASEDICNLEFECSQVKDFLHKIDIKKKIDGKKKDLEKLQSTYHQKVSAIEEEATKEIEAYIKSVEITPLLMVKAMVKF